MSLLFRSIDPKWKKHIFFIDAIGALVSTVFLVLLSIFSNWFGMPAAICILLAIIAMVLVVHSGMHHFLKRVPFKPAITAIITGNVLYCVITIFFLVRFHGQLTYPGWIYFIGELLIIFSLIAVQIFLLKDHRLKK